MSDEHHHEGHEGVLDILLDPAHMVAEVVSHLIIEAVILLVLAPLLRAYVNRQHNKIDAEHGVTNHGAINYEKDV